MAVTVLSEIKVIERDLPTVLVASSLFMYLGVLKGLQVAAGRLLCHGGQSKDCRGSLACQVEHLCGENQVPLPLSTASRAITSSLVVSQVFYFRQTMHTGLLHDMLKIIISKYNVLCTLAMHINTYTRTNMICTLNKLEDVTDKKFD